MCTRYVRYRWLNGSEFFRKSPALTYIALSTVFMSLAHHLSNKTIITVSGTYSGVGKTLLAEYTLSLLNDFSAIKITVDNIFTSVSSNDASIMVPGKDTYRLKTSGAEQVIWVKTSEENLFDAVEQAFSLMGTCSGVLIEGNSILTYLVPDIAFFVHSGEVKPFKPSRLYALQKAHVVINNIRDTGDDSVFVEDQLKEYNSRATMVSLNLIKRDIMVAFLKNILQQRIATGLLR